MKLEMSPELIEAFRIALSMAEEKLEEFKGDIEALRELLKHAKVIGGDVSERADEELARILQAENR